MKIEIKHRGTRQLLYSANGRCIKDIVVLAVKSHANLSGADLTGANLSGADLTDTDLTGADLSHADLMGADLSHADLSDADLSDADLTGAGLSHADLSDADLTGADLSHADLSDADLTGADLSSIQEDFGLVLTSAPHEVTGLRQALVSGTVDGSTYEGKCACLVGTIAKVRGVNYNELVTLQPDSNRPAEIFFLAIREGDRPDNNPFSKLAVDWIDQWLDREVQTTGV